jgi:hypothetical protein
MEAGKFSIKLKLEDGNMDILIKKLATKDIWQKEKVESFHSLWDSIAFGLKTKLRANNYLQFDLSALFYHRPFAALLPETRIGPY